VVGSIAIAFMAHALVFSIIALSWSKSQACVSQRAAAKVAQDFQVKNLND